MGEFDKTDFLTPPSTFRAGMASCLDLGGTFFRYNISRSSADADANAIFMDWKMAGNDLRQAMKSSTPADLSTVSAPR